MRGADRWPIAVAALAVAVVCVSSCQSPPSSDRYVKDGVRYGVTPGVFNHQWWNYYQRGLSYADGGFWAEAESDLRRALDMNPREARRAQTYGMHFLDYFPHRELGIVQYHQQRYPEARTYLAKSLALEDSARGHYFLGLVEGKLLRASQEDMESPAIDVADGSILYSSAETLWISGWLRDDRGVWSYSVDSVPYYIREPRRVVRLACTVPVSATTREVVIEAADLVGKRTRLALLCVRDQTGPVITLRPAARDASGWWVRGEVVDNGRLRELTINNRSVTAEPDGTFRAHVGSEVRAAVVRAVDAAGNESVQSFNLLDRPGQAVPRIKVGRLPTGTRLAVGEGDSASIKLTRRPPRRVSGAYISLHLDLAAESSITRVVIAGEPILGLPHRRTLAFSHRVELSPGENVVEIAIETAHGAKATRSVAVQRLDAEKPLREQRLRLAYYQLSHRETIAVNRDKARLFNDTFEHQLSSSPRFAFLWRRDLERLMLERKLNLSGLADPDYSLRLRSLKIADLLVTGSVRLRGDGIIAETKLIDTRTGEVEQGVDVFHEKTDTRTLEMLARALTTEMENHFPLVRGKVVALDEDAQGFVWNRGEASGLREGLEVVVFKQEDFELTVLGHATVDGVMPGKAHAGVEEDIPQRRGDAEIPGLQVGLEVQTR